jgi:hypothetical protein
LPALKKADPATRPSSVTIATRDSEMGEGDGAFSSSLISERRKQGKWKMT